jgi:hypothetical protein
VGVQFLPIHLKLVTDLAVVATFDFLKSALDQWLVALLLMLGELPSFLKTQIT